MRFRKSSLLAAVVLIAAAGYYAAVRPEALPHWARAVAGPLGVRGSAPASKHKAPQRRGKFAARGGDAVSFTPDPHNPYIRVGLATKGAPIRLLCGHAMIVSDALKGGRLLTVTAGDMLTVELVRPDAGGKTASPVIKVSSSAGSSSGWQTVRIAPGGEPTHVATGDAPPRQSRAYYGAFEIARQTYSFEPAMHAGGLRLINIVPLDDYLKGVVPWEMNSSAPLEALKAQAICARSETLAKIRHKRHGADGFDICDYDHCQGYCGTENEDERSDRAVDQTSGLAIFYGNEIADAVYGTNSGGITAASEDVWRGPPEPYLRSVRDFTASHGALARLTKGDMSEADWVQYCTQNLPSFAQPSNDQVRQLASRRASSPRTAALFQENDLPEFYRWTRTVSAADLARALGSRAKMESATSVQVLERSRSGHIKRLEIKGRYGKDDISVVFEGDSKIRAMLSGRLGSTSALPSSTFIVQTQRDSAGKATGFVFRGAGWGHGAGMCQRGAQARALAGWNARQIVNFYYTGVTVREIG